MARSRRLDSCEASNSDFTQQSNEATVDGATAALIGCCAGAWAGAVTNGVLARHYFFLLPNHAAKRVCDARLTNLNWRLRSLITTLMCAVSAGLDKDEAPAPWLHIQRSCRRAAQGDGRAGSVWPAAGAAGWCAGKRSFQRALLWDVRPGKAAAGPPCDNTVRWRRSSAGRHPAARSALRCVPSYSTNSFTHLTVDVQLGNIVSSAVLVPKEVIKQRMQAGAAGGALAVAAAVLRVDGVRGLYRGYLSTLLRNAPSNVISFSSFEAFKALQLSRLEEGSVLHPSANGAAGFAAGCIAAVCTQPLDLVKTRLMTQGVTKLSGQQLYHNVWGTLRSVYAQEGPRGLMRGLEMRLLFSGAFGCIGFPLFEGGKQALLRRRPRARKSLLLRHGLASRRLQQ